MMARLRRIRIAGFAAIALVAACGHAFAASPTVTAVSPNPFSYSGGQTVTVTGTGFFCGGSSSCVSSATIGGAAATNINVTSDTTLTATTPADIAPPSSPTVTSPSGGITPNFGSTSGGTGVTINGTGFGHAVDVIVTTTNGSGTGSSLFSYNDVQLVEIGGTTASTFTFVSPTKLTASSPPGVVGVGNVIIVTAGGNTGSTGNNEFAYIQGGPSIQGITPSFGLTNSATNTHITINGSNFVPGQFQDGTFATTVTFGCGPATNATTSNVANVAIATAAVPSCATAGAVPVRVTLRDGNSASVNYLYVGPQTPIVTQIINTSSSSPFNNQAKGTTKGGDQVTISGSNFIGATQVTIGGTAVTAFSVTDGGHITTATPPGTAGPASVTVTVPQASTPDGTGNNIFTYVQPAPQVLSVQPSTGGTVGGDPSTIRGSGFTGATIVAFGSNSVSCPSASCTVVNDTEIDVKTPAATSAGVVDVIVTAPGGTSVTSSFDQFTYAALATVTGISPSLGPAAGGNQITITGTNFTNASTVRFGSVPATVTDSSGIPNSLKVTAPAGAAGSVVDVQVSVQVSSNPVFSTANSSDKYTYQGPPTVNSVSPNAGSTAGGYDVKIKGVNFTGATQVVIGGAILPCPAQCTVSSDTLIDVPSVPPGTAGAASVVVTTPNGSNPANSLFTYFAPSTNVTSSPTSGPVGTSVTITGNNFAGRISVAFGTNQAISFSVNSTTSITAIAPPGTGTVPVTVTTPAGTFTSANSFTYTVPPTVSITSPAPPQGPQGASVVITASTGVLTSATAVQFGGVNATKFTIDSPTQITATAPPGTGTVSVTVATPNGAATTANQFTYLGAPTVTSISPPSGPPGGNYQVIISGTSLTGASAVRFGSTPAIDFTYNSGTQQITATVPAGTNTVDVTVTTSLGTSAINRPSDQFTYTTVPAVSGISPTSGPSTGGTSVTITGNNLAGATAVKFGGVAGAIVSNSPTTIVVTSPAGSGTVDVSVTTAAGSSAASSADRFTYIPPAPTISGFTPNSGSTTGGTSVTISGTNLSGATSVTFGTTAAAITANTAGSITVTSPSGTGSVALTVTTPGGTVTSTGKFTYTAPTPTVTSVSPNVGPKAGNATVTITGTNFTGATAVKFGTVNATSFQFNSATQITAVTPAGSAGAVDVTVTTAAATSAINQPADQYTYGGPPVVTGISISTGPSAGATSVTITGSNFTGATAVNFGSTPGTSVSVNGSGTSITVLSPPGSGTVDVTVVTPNGTSGTGTFDRFTYAKANTALALTSSPNPSSFGQPVTFTALITGNAPTGTVIFTSGATQIGSATLSSRSPTSSAASFTISTLPVGADPVTASYAGDANNAPDPETVTQYVNAATDSVKLRELQIAAMSVASNTSASAITGAIDSAIGAGFAGACQMGPRPNGSGFTYCFDGDEPPQNPSPRAMIDDGFKALGYADDLPGLPGTLRSSALDARAADLTLGGVERPAVAPIAQPREWLVWADVRASQLIRTGTANDLSGMQGNAMFGLTRRFSSNFLIGVTGGYENFQYKSETYNGVLRGQGPTAGAYLGWLLNDSLRFEAAGAWSEIFVNETAGAASGQFTGQRGLAFANLTGNFGMLGTTFEPSAQIYAVGERENRYTDSLGTLQASHDFETGRASGGLKTSHAFSVGDSRVVPYLGLYGDYYFTMDNANGAPGLTPVLLMHGLAARANGGLTAVLPNGAQMSVGGERSGIGNSTHIWMFNVRGSVPF